MGWRGLAAWIHRNKKKLSLRKKYFFVIETCVKDVIQGERIVPDLVEWIIRTTRLATEESRKILMKISQVRPHIEEI